jgi:hypothetical protein
MKLLPQSEVTISIFRNCVAVLRKPVGLATKYCSSHMRVWPHTHTHGNSNVGGCQNPGPQITGAGLNLISGKWLGYTRGTRGTCLWSRLTRQAWHLACARRHSDLVLAICQKHGSWEQLTLESHREQVSDLAQFSSWNRTTRNEAALMRNWHLERVVAASQGFMGSIPVEVTGFFNWSNLSSRTMTDSLCGLMVSVLGFRTEMYCDFCEVRTEFIYVM